MFFSAFSAVSSEAGGEILYTRGVGDRVLRKNKKRPVLAVTPASSIRLPDQLKVGDPQPNRIYRRFEWKNFNLWGIGKGNLISAVGLRLRLGVSIIPRQ
jgi:hypothetical protein